jgi:AAA+ ATPase superfamily predicted ATPase
MEFINREEELGFLNGKWNENEAQLIILYGKRRVGKTELTIQFSKDKPHIYFLCEMIASQKQLQKFTESLSDYFKDEFLPEQGFRDWEQAFKYIAGKNEKMVIVIDEFPYLAETDSSVPSSFQKIWDLYLKSSQIFLILLGSSISMMEKTVLSHKAPLYGRRTGQILLKPFSFGSVKSMFPEKTFNEIVCVYSTTGGTPLYLNKFKNKKYFETVRHEIFTKGQPLYAEVEFLLREELKEPRNYFVILEAISLGKHKLSEIINETGLEKSIVSRYISILNSLNITQKVVPVTEMVPEKSRKSLYIIDDNFFSFWFRFVFKNHSKLEENRSADVIKTLQEQIIGVNAASYEKIAREVIKSQSVHNPQVLQFDDVGKWWDKNEEIDVVAVNRSSNSILFGEVKWSKKSVGTDIYRELKRKAALVEWGKEKRKEYFCLFSKSGFTDDMLKMAKEENVFLFTEDLLLS